MSNLSNYLKYKIFFGLILSSISLSVLAYHHHGTESFTEAFQSASDRSMQPRFRWWWPGAMVEEDELRREINEIADAGFGGVEIADVYDSVSETIDPKLYGWGTQRWNDSVAVVMDEAAKRGLTVDITVGPHWPSALPTVTPQSDAAAKEMVHGKTIVSGGATYQGAVPDPVADPSGVTDGNPDPDVKTELLAVLAARCISSCTTDDSDSSIALSKSSVVDLTDQVSDDQITWTAPSGGSWVLLAFYGRTTGQIVNMYDRNTENSPVTSPRSYVVDHFGSEGSQAVIDYWNETLLTPQVLNGLRETGGSIFEDSLELKALQYWTDDAFDTFTENRGYSVLKYLPVLMYQSTSHTVPVFTFGDEDFAEKVRHDWAQTMGDMWQENHLEALYQWAQSKGFSFRNQPYGGPLDTALGAATTGQPEGESLGFGDEPGGFQTLRAGRDMGTGGIVSDEMGAFMSGGYATQWTTDMLPTMNRNFAYGVNQLYVHGYAYDTAPGVTWPGFSAFGTSFGEAWNSKLPSWQHIKDMSGYMTRTQMVLQQGMNKTDVVVIRSQKSVDDGYLEDLSALEAGYTVGYLSPSVLDLDTVHVSGGRLNSNGPAYKALILPLDSYLTESLVEKVRRFSYAGLPVILLGSVSDIIDDNSGTLASEINLLSQNGKVYTVTSEEDLANTLEQAGVTPDAQPGAAGNLRAVHRQSGSIDFYYLFNDSEDDTLSDTVSLSGSGTPYILDPWTGQIEKSNQYTTGNGRVSLNVSLQPSQTKLVAIQQGNSRYLHTTTPDDMGINIRNDNSVSTGSLPDTVTLTDWTLSVISYQPGDEANETSYEEITGTSLGEDLVPWTEIDALSGVSGIGTYRSVVTLPDTWPASTSAYITFDSHSDTIRVRVNGIELSPVDQLAMKVDAGHLFKSGQNVIEIELTTPLHNALLNYEPDLFDDTEEAQENGLIGTVQIVPYLDAGI
jgi:hypothetical protein